MPDFGRLIGAFKAAVDALTSRVDYHAMYPCTVVAQDGNELELLPDDAKVRGFGVGSVPIKPGAPGYEFEVPEGARVLLGFEAGDPSRPYCSLWESATDVDTITFDGGSEDIARTNDSVDAGYLVFETDNPATMYLPTPPVYFPGGAVGQAAATAYKAWLDDPVSNPTKLGVLVSINQGIITSGNTKLKA